MEQLLVFPFSKSTQKSAGIIDIEVPDDDDIIIETGTLSLVLPVPSGVFSGDVLVALISTDGNPTITTESGWVREASIGGTAKSFVYYRVSNGIEPATYTWTLDGAEDAVGSIIKLSDVNTTNPINAKVTNSGTGSTINIPSITTTVAKCMLVTLLSLNDGVLISTSGLTSRNQISLWVVNTSGEDIGSVGSSASYKTLKKAGTEPAYNLNTLGGSSTDYFSVQIAFNPRGTNPTPPPTTPAFDAFSDGTFVTSNPHDFTHTPVGSPRGIIIFVIDYGDNLDRVSGVTYGGIAVPEIDVSPLIPASANSTIHCFFLGSGIPTGAKTVSVSKTGAFGMQPVCISLTANRDTQIEDQKTILSGAATDPSVTLNLHSAKSFCAEAFNSNHGDVTDISPFTNWTARDESDIGLEVGGFYTYNIVDLVDVVAGWIQTEAIAIMIGIAVSEA